MTRTTHTAAFKKKVALEALKEEKTLAQIGSQYGVHPVQVCKWKKMLIDGAEGFFTDARKERKSEDWQQEAYERKVGQMAVELDYLKKKLGQLA
jgi:transposase-like protein